jgi:hypothetical protein
MKAYWGSGGIAETFLTSAQDGGEWAASRPGRLTPRERAPGTHWIGGWVGPRAGLDAVVKRTFPSFCRDSNLPIIQLVAQRYTTELTRLIEVITWILRSRGLHVNFKQRYRNRFTNERHVVIVAFLCIDDIWQ